MNKNDFKFCTIDDIVGDAIKHKYALPHINTNNLEWTKAILMAADETKTPIIIAVSEGAAKYFTSLKTAYELVKAVAFSLNVKVPVVLHLDHGSLEACYRAIDVGFSSVMFDGSHLDFQVNLDKTKKIFKYITNSKKRVSLEVELGTIGGEEDGVLGYGEYADINQCLEFAKLPISILAAGIGNIHGIYPPHWKGLNFELLKKISVQTNKPIVLHGGSGIPDDQVVKAIAYGIRKVNVNTELQLAFQAAIREYILAGKDLEVHKKGYDPRRLLKPGFEAMKAKAIEKFKLFGAIGRALHTS